MTRQAATRWAIGVITVIAVAVIGVTVNLAVLRSNDEHPRIGVLNARGTGAGSAMTAGPSTPGASSGTVGRTTSLLPTRTGHPEGRGETHHRDADD